MTHYILRRLLLLPLTLFVIILVNFVILNLTPGDPTSITHLSATGEATRSADTDGVIEENAYLIFREHYGLTLPILFNTWLFLDISKVKKGLEQLAHFPNTMSIQAHHKLNTLWGDRARFIMPLLIAEAVDESNSLEIRKIAANLFVRGGQRQGVVGTSLTHEQKKNNRLISENNLFLSNSRISNQDTYEEMERKIYQLAEWFQIAGGNEGFKKTTKAKMYAMLFETRFSRYLSRIITLDFGTLRNDSNKKVIHEVGKRIKYSFTLAVIPLTITFFLCQVFGMMMALNQNQWLDYSLNIVFLILFAIPVFVVAPFLIEKFALNKTIPFTTIPIPHSGFHSPLEIYDHLTSFQRFGDIVLHLFLPLIAIKYGSLAMQARLARTAFLEVFRQNHVRTARAKGLSTFQICIKHVGRNGAITVITSLAASLGMVLGGSLIVETLFEINGFGRFFYDAIINRDYNVVLFSAFASSFLTLIGFLVADIFYMLLDPRVSFE